MPVELPWVGISLWGADPLQSANVELDDLSDTPKVHSVTVEVDGQTIGYTVDANVFGGSAQASKDGSAYKITGSGWQVGTLTTKPFENNSDLLIIRPAARWSGGQALRYGGSALWLAR